MNAVVTRAELEALEDFDLAYLDRELQWRQTGRPNQMPPDGDWYLWLIRSGRMWGKTRTAAQWCMSKAYHMPGSIGHVVARTSDDLWRTAFEGPAGLIKTIPPAMIADYNKNQHRIRFRNGSEIFGFTAEKPDSLRGPQGHWAWCDELAAWMYADEVWDQVAFSTRLPYPGTEPQILVTTTPKPRAIIKALSERDDVRLVLGSSYENEANIAPAAFKEIAKYEGTVFGDQEIHGKLIDLENAGIIKRSWFRIWPNIKPLPYFEYVVVSLDTAFTEKTYDKKKQIADPTACTVWGVFMFEKQFHIILLECWRDMLGMPALIERAKKEMAAIYGQREETLFKPMVGNPYVMRQEKKPDLLVIEDKGSGISLRQMLAKENVLTHPYNPGNADKLARLHAVSHIPAAGLIWLPQSTTKGNEDHPRNWVLPFLDEVCTFAGEGTTKHDDYVDSASQAWRVIADMYLTRGVQKPKEREPGDPVVLPQEPVSNPYSA